MGKAGFLLMVRRSLLSMIFGLLSCLSATAGELRYFGYDGVDGRVGGFKIDTQNGQVSWPNTDVTYPFKHCGLDSDYFCVLAMNRGLAFALPKSKERLKSGWTFSGYDFELKGTKLVYGALVYVVTARMRDEFLAHHQEIDGLPRRTEYFYSELSGVLAWSTFQDDPKIDRSSRILWTNSNPPSDFSDWLRLLPSGAELTSKQQLELRTVDLRFDQFVDLIFGSD